MLPSVGSLEWRGLLDGWSGQQMAIAVDATTLGDHFVVLAISVVNRTRAGCLENLKSLLLLNKDKASDNEPVLQMSCLSTHFVWLKNGVKKRL
jgi:hypothetical protein